MLPKMSRGESRRLTLGERLHHAYGRLGAGMWHERKMPERWHELLRERMHVEELRMRVVKDGSIVDRLEDLLTEAHNLDREMLQVMRQAIAEALAREEVSRPQAA
jgi:hypothetical protein